LEYQRILSECVERGGRPDVVIMAMENLRGEKTSRECARLVNVNQSRLLRAKASLLSELNQLEKHSG
jgi:hypothetical protein